MSFYLPGLITANQSQLFKQIQLPASGAAAQQQSQQAQTSAQSTIHKVGSSSNLSTLQQKVQLLQRTSNIQIVQSPGQRLTAPKTVGQSTTTLSSAPTTVQFQSMQFAPAKTGSNTATTTTNTQPSKNTIPSAVFSLLQWSFHTFLNSILVNLGSSGQSITSLVSALNNSNNNNGGNGGNGNGQNAANGSTIKTTQILPSISTLTTTTTAKTTQSTPGVLSHQTANASLSQVLRQFAAVNPPVTSTTTITQTSSSDTASNQSVAVSASTLAQGGSVSTSAPATSSSSNTESATSAAQPQSDQNK